MPYTSINGHMFSPYRLSPDGNHVAWAGLFDPDGADASARPVLDDRIGPAFDRVLDWTFLPDGSATWYAQRGRSLIRISAAA